MSVDKQDKNKALDHFDMARCDARIMRDNLNEEIAKGLMELAKEIREIRLGLTKILEKKGCNCE